MQTEILPKRRFAYMTPARWCVLAAISFGVGAMCAVFSVIFTQWSNAGFGEEVLAQAIVDSVTLSFGLGVPVTAMGFLRLFQVRYLNAELLRLASHDPLTECLNRRALLLRFQRLMAGMTGSKAETQGALLLIDADYFKQLNDELGHLAGDSALCLIADAVRGAIREEDALARVGGEEFIVLLADASPDLVMQIADQIVDTVRETHMTANGKSVRLAVSVGGALFQGQASFDDLFREADANLYRAKRDGRDRAVFPALAA